MGKKQKLIVLVPLYWMVIPVTVFIIAGILWSIGEERGLAGFSDRLFIVSFVYITLGAVITLTSTSRRQYYQYLSEKSKMDADIDKIEKEYSVDVENRRRYRQYGLVLAVSGFLGFIASGAILRFMP